MFIDRTSSDYMVADEKWSKYAIHIMRPKPSQLKRLCFIAACSAMLYRGYVFAHGALIDWNGHGIMFIGPSGIGKSTQAELWQKNKCATIINGDVTLVGKNGVEYFGYGSPWHGTSPHCLNKAVPLHAVIVLEQSEKNQLNRLLGAQMVKNVLNNVIVPRWLPDCYLLVLDILEGMMGHIPVYQLRNRADIASVQLLADEVISCFTDKGDMYI